jgi:Resolvase, N terminal domain
VNWKRRRRDTLVVWKLDRLGTSVKELIATMNFLAEQGIGFKSLTDNIDTTTSGGNRYTRLLLHYETSWGGLYFGDLPAAEDLQNYVIPVCQTQGARKATTEWVNPAIDRTALSNFHFLAGTKFPSDRASNPSRAGKPISLGMVRDGR